jgi:hypothetical protein
VVPVWQGTRDMGESTGKKVKDGETLKEKKILH